jgi:pimeloyl-ACP methyl ester carboxylesterase
VFDDVATRLARQFRVFGLTPRGCGASGRPASGYGMTEQVQDIFGFLNDLGIDRAILIGHSSGGGKITQFALRHPERVHRLVYLDTVYRFVAPGLEERIDKEIAQAVGEDATDSVELRKRRARLWELGAWSPAMDRNFEEIFQVEPDGRVRARSETPPEWRRDVNRDMEAGLYTDTRISVPALMIFAMDTDRERARQFGPAARRDLTPLIASTERERRKEIEKFQANGNHVRVVMLRRTAHYCFVQRPGTIARLIAAFLRP